MAEGLRGRRHGFCLFCETQGNPTKAGISTNVAGAAKNRADQTRGEDNGAVQRKAATRTLAARWNQSLENGNYPQCRRLKLQSDGEPKPTGMKRGDRMGTTCV